MKYKVRIDENEYVVEAAESFEAKLQAARQHFNARPNRFASPNDVIIRSKIEVNRIEEKP